MTKLLPEELDDYSDEFEEWKLQFCGLLVNFVLSLEKNLKTFLLVACIAIIRLFFSGESKYLI